MEITSPPSSPRWDSNGSPNESLLPRELPHKKRSRCRDVSFPASSSHSNGSESHPPITTKRRPRLEALNHNDTDSGPLSSRTVIVAPPALVIPEFAQNMHEYLIQLQAQYLQFDSPQPNESEFLTQLEPLASFISSLTESSLEKPVLEKFLFGYLFLVYNFPSHQAIEKLPLHQPFIQDIILNEWTPRICDGHVLAHVATHLKDPERQSRLFAALPKLRNLIDAPSILTNILPNLSTTAQQLQYINEVAKYCNPPIQRRLLAQLMKLENLSPAASCKVFLFCYHPNYITDDRHQDVMQYLSPQQIQGLLNYAHEITDVHDLKLFYKCIACFAKNTNFFSLDVIFLNIIQNPCLAPYQYTIVRDTFYDEQTKNLDDFRTIFTAARNHPSLMHRYQVAYNLSLFRFLFPAEEHPGLLDAICDMLCSCFHVSIDPIDTDFRDDNFCARMLNFIKKNWMENPPRSYWKLVQYIIGYDTDIQGGLEPIMLFIDEKLSQDPQKQNILLKILEDIFIHLPTGELGESYVPYLMSDLEEYYQKILTQLAFNPIFSRETRYALLFNWAKHAKDLSPELYQSFLLHIAGRSELKAYWVDLVNMLAPKLTDTTSLQRAFSLVRIAEDDMFEKMKALTAITKQISNEELLFSIYNTSLTHINAALQQQLEKIHLQIVSDLCTELQTKISEFLQTCTNAALKASLTEMLKKVNSRIYYKLQSGSNHYTTEDF